MTHRPFSFLCITKHDWSHAKKPKYFKFGLRNYWCLDQTEYAAVAFQMIVSSLSKYRKTRYPSISIDLFSTEKRLIRTFSLNSYVMYLLNSFQKYHYCNIVWVTLILGKSSTRIYKCSLRINFFRFKTKKQKLICWTKPKVDQWP